MGINKCGSERSPLSGEMNACVGFDSHSLLPFLCVLVPSSFVFLVEREACRCRTISVRIILNCCENELRDRFHKWLLTLSLGFIKPPTFFVFFPIFYYYDTYYFLFPPDLSLQCLKRHNTSFLSVQ